MSERAVPAAPSRPSRLPLAVAAICCLTSFAGVVLLLVNGQSLLEGFNLALIATGTGFAIAGALVCTRVPGNLLGPLFLVAASLWAADLLLNQYASYGFYTAPGGVPLLGLAVWLTSWIWIPGTGIVMFATPVMFPDGHLPSPRWRVVVMLVSIAVTISVVGHAAVVWPIRDTMISLQPDFNPSNLPTLAGQIANLGDTLVFLPTAILGGTALVLRYRRSTGVARLQMRWFTYAIVLSIACTIASGLLGDIAPGLTAVAGATLALIPAAMVFAMLRYRLYEIDRIIGRTVAYAAVTAVLATVFLGLNLVLQTLLADATGEGTLTVAISTLVVAALFQPLRRRIQAPVDRRFNRARVNAEQVIEAFAGDARDEVDLVRLRGSVIGAARKAVAPDGAGLWLRGQA